MSKSPPLELDGQVVLVSGGGRNLGRAVVLEAAARGASVGIMVRSDERSAEGVAREAESLGAHAAILVGDVSDPRSVDRMVSLCAGQLGPVSSVVHCAASRTHVPLCDLSLTEWRRSIAVSLGGAQLLARYTIPSMVERGFGRIIFVAGTSAFVGLPTGTAQVATAKSALRGLARALAQEVGTFGVAVNVVSPGAIDDGQGRQLPDMGKWDPVRASTLGRMATREEIAKLCIFLCSREAVIIQGQALIADGGIFGFDD